MPTMYIIAGCNGAGKTTAAFSLLPEVFKTVEFVNADEIARGISPFNPEGVAFHAGRIMLERLNELIINQKDFAFETTLSGHTYLKFVEMAKAKEYTVILLFVYLSSVELAKERVAVRVSKGGHNIPGEVIIRRYFKGLKNFLSYGEKVNSWYIYDNSGKEYLFIAKKLDDKIEIFNLDVYKKVIDDEK
jgi:predicted ABC-type ATPase